MRVIIVHALRNAMLPVVTVIGLQAGNIAGGGDSDRNHLLVARSGTLVD